MTPQDALIIAFAAVDLICLIALAVVGLRFKALAGEGQRIARPLVDRGRRIAGTGRQMALTGKDRGETIVHVVQTLAARLSAKVATTRRILNEVAHPHTSSLEKVARTLEEGRAWSDRLSRLRSAAQRAAGPDGHGRGPIAY
jgi:hypothetical protein